MRLKSLELSNFRAFAFEHELDFSFDKNKNINIIVAENEVGKTTLLNSLLFTFYGNLSSSSENRTHYINDEAKKRGKTSGYTQATLIHPDDYDKEHPDEYKFRRSFSSRAGSAGPLKGYMIDGITGEQQTITDPQQWIDSVFPEAIANYFFFDGEGIGEITSNTELLLQAIRNIQGLNPAELAIQDLDKIIEKKNGDLREANKDKTELSTILKSLEDIGVKLKDNNKALKKPKQLRIRLDADEKKLRAELRSMDHADIKDLEAEERTIKKNLDSAKKRLDTNSIARQKYLGTYAPYIFGSSFHKDLRKNIEEREDIGNLPAGYEDTFVNGILSKLVCICGVDFKKGDAMYKEIKSMLETAKTQELSNKLFSIKATLDENIKNFNNFGDSLREIEERIYIAENDIKRFSEDLKNNRKLQEGIDHKKIQNLIEKIKNVETKQFDNQKLLNGLEFKKDRLEKKQKQKNSDLKRLNKKNNLSGDAQDLQFLMDTKETLISIKNKTESDGLNEISDLMNQNLQKFGRGFNTFEFDKETSRPKILKRNWDEEEDADLSEPSMVEATLSKGGAAVKRNLFFACSLIMQSKKRLNDNTEYLIQGKSAPMVVDAPFSNLDNTNTKMLTKLLIDTSDQLIIFVSSTAYNGAIDEVLQDRKNKSKLGRLYYLKRFWRGPNKGGPDKEMPITINNKVIKTGIYDQALETSQIELVMEG